MQYTDLIGKTVSYIWILFVLVWLISSFFAKKYKTRANVQFVAFRLILAVLIIAFIGFGGHATFLLAYIHNETLRIIGAVLAVAGIALAFWARFYLGRNWGMPMSVKAEAELVTTGPYAHIRHPIYSGITLAMFGTALVFGMAWVFVLIIYVAYFMISVPREDAIMARIFPDTYPAYKARTKKLIPWVW